MIKNDLLAPFIEQVKSLCALETLPDIHIALSGGLDSVVLLHLFVRLHKQQAKIKISAHHINHRLSDNARLWSDFCAQLCADSGVDFSCSNVSLQRKTRTSLEALAREKRYACLTEQLTKNSYLVTAHHQDDQLESVLLALKRGAGNTGLQGIRSHQTLTKGYLIRPLLNFSRQQLADYAQAFNLLWIEDDSNSDQVFDRNYIRHRISPLLKARWPAIAKTVARSASICQEQQQLLDEVAQSDFSECCARLLNQSRLDINKLKVLSPARRNNLLRYWFKDNNLSYPSAKQLLAVWTDIVLAKPDASPQMSFKEVTLRRYREQLYLIKAPLNKKGHDVKKGAITWQGEAQISLFNGDIELVFTRTKEKKGALSVSSGAQVVVCFREHLEAGLRCTPLGRVGSRTIKKLLHEYHVPPWLRDQIPFILINGELQAAVGLWQCQAGTAGPHDYYLQVSFA